MLTMTHKRSKSFGSLAQLEKGAMSMLYLMRSGSVSSVRQLTKLFEMRSSMAEGRKSQIILLDDRQLEILIQPKLYTEELLDLVASHFNLKEKEYFGLAFQDETGHFNWLHLDRKVLEHEFPKRTGSLILYFSVRFFIESIAYLRDNATVELFYLQAKQAIAKGDLECDSETAFELAAYVLQATFGDYTDDETAKHHLRKLPVLPTSALRAHPSISYCEDQVLGHYVKLGGQSRGSAIVSYMTIVESLPTYGIHYYEVKDKSGIPWWLGLSYKGISQYDHNDKKTPRRVFSWKQLENLYFRDKKFSIEVHDPKRIVHTLSSFNLYEDAIQEPIEEFDSLSDAISDPTTQVSVSRRTFGPGNVNVHAWFSLSPQLTKCIWSMAVNQHQFYLDRKQTKTQLPTVRSMSEIAADLSQSMTSLPSSGMSDGISRSNSAHSLSHIPSTNSIKVEMSMEQLEASRAAKQEMITALKSRKETLEETLKEKLEALKALCIQEGELTGELPPEIPLAPGEKPPAIRRRVGTEFTLSPKVMQDSRNQGEQYLSKLEMEYELQDQITKAALKLAQDTSVAKTVRKKRKHSYHRAHQKLKDLEKKLNEARKYAGFAAVKAGYSSVEDLSCDSEGYLDSEPEFISPIGSPSPRRNKGHKGPEVEVVDLQKQPVTQPLPQTPQSGGMTRGSTPSPQGQRRLGGGYTPSSVYTTRTHYRTQTYPTFTSQPQQTNNSQYDNLDMVGSKMGEPNGPRMYPNVHYNSPQRALRYESADELKSSSHEDGLDAAYSDDESYSRTKYGSLEGHYKRRSREFPEGRLLTTSLERNRSSPMLLPELTPSRFGSKRESSCDPKESIYPYPTDHMGAHMQPHAEHVQFQVGAPVTSSYGGQYTGHMQGSPHVPSGTYFPHDVSNMRQQEPPHTPQYEVPPTAFLQEQDITNRIPQVEPQNVTVKKYQGYMEVSKPFEMSDFYKYSERLRKQHHRPTDHYNVRTAQSSYQSPATPVNRQYASVPNTVQVQQSRSRPGSPFAHRDSGASPKDSPINSLPYHGCRNDNVRGPQVAHPVGGVYQGYHGTQTSPRVMPLQHPQPMTCEPVQGTPIHKNTPDRSYSETQLDRHRAIVGDFGDEMLSWYDGQGDGDRSSTLV